MNHSNREAVENFLAAGRDFQVALANIAALRQGRWDKPLRGPLAVYGAPGNEVAARAALGLSLRYLAADLGALRRAWAGLPADFRAWVVAETELRLALRRLSRSLDKCAAAVDGLAHAIEERERAA